MVGSCSPGYATPDDEMVDHFGDGGFSESGRRCEWHGPVILPLIALNFRLSVIQALMQTLPSPLFVLFTLMETDK